jgi:hypothetical protein
MWFWTITAIPGILIGRTFKITYFYQLIPPLLIIIAWSVPLIQQRKKSVQALLTFLFTAVLILTPAQYLQSLQIFRTLANDSEDWYSIIDYLKTNTKVTDCIWLWGHINQVHYYSHLPSCVAASYEGPVMIEDGFDIQKNRPQYLQDLFKNHPAYHVNTSSWSYFPMLERFVQRYRREGIEELAYPVFRMDMSSWHERNVHFEDKFTLIGVDEFQGTEVCKGDSLRYATTWRVENPPQQYYQMFVHLRDLKTHSGYFGLDIPPAIDFPTQDWSQVGEIVLGDTFEVLIPEDISSGDYYIALGFYDTETLERIEIWDEQEQIIGSEIQLTQITVSETCEDS